MKNTFLWLFSFRQGAADRLIPRWIVLRALGLIYCSAFISLLFQIRGLMGPNGILPAQGYLAAVAQSFGPLMRLWFAPTVLWLNSGSSMLMAMCWVGLAASLLLAINIWPRAMLAVCFVCFLSFVSAAQDFSGYQSDGMLLEAGFIALFFAPSGLRPGLARTHPASRASLFLLLWEWFRIYFESGAVKLLSGDLQWRHFTAMDEYYQNGPLPTWVGWYLQHLPHWFHAATAGATLTLELALVWMLFLPRRWRIVCFFIVTPWEIGVILSANYTFLNYLVLSLGFLLLDDKTLLRFVPERFRPQAPAALSEENQRLEQPLSILVENEAISDEAESANPEPRRGLAAHIDALRLAVAAVMLSWIAYDTTAEMIGIPLRGVPLPITPITALEPFRIANQYGLFAVMTRGRYEIEFQGSTDGQNWVPYPFQCKPQALNEAPRIYAPYQPRFDWNLWFASLGNWRQNDLVPLTEERLLGNDADVLALFRSSPFQQSPPSYVRAVLWQYWFTRSEEHTSE